MVDEVSRIDMRRGVPLSGTSAVSENVQEHAAVADGGVPVSSAPKKNPSAQTIFEDTAPKSVTQNISSDTSDYPNLSIKKVAKAVIKPHADAIKYIGSIGCSIYERHEANLKKVKAARECLLKKEQSILERVWAFISSPFKNDDYEEIDVLLAQLLDEIHDKSKDEKQCLIKDFYSDSRMMIDLPEAQGLFGRYTRFSKLSAKSVRKITEKFSHSRSFTRKLALAVMNRYDDKQFVVRGALEDVPEAQNDLKELIFKYLPESMTESQVNEVFEALGKYADMQAADILASMQNGKFKQKFIDEIRKKAKQVIEESNRRIKEYIKEFYETAKGRTVKRLIKTAYEKTQYAQKEVQERKEMTKAASQKAKEAKKQSEKAIAEAKAEESRCRSTAEKCGYKYLDGDKLYKFMKQVSPMQAIDLSYAKAKEKKAYWAAYDAKSAQRLAESMEKMAQNRFEFENLRMEAMFSRMQALVATEFVS